MKITKLFQYIKKYVFFCRNSWQKKKNNKFIKTFYTFDHKNKKEEYLVFDDKREGEYKGYYENGQLMEIYNYKNDMIR